MRKEFKVDRRQFMTLAGTSGAALIGAHLAFGNVSSPSLTSPVKNRIARLDLRSSARSSEMREFYGDLLGLPLAESDDESITVAAGNSLLHFQEIPGQADRPFYHFAFNIPENKIRSALEWQKRRTPMLPIPEHLRDPAFPPEVVDYSHWNAHSIFFLDPAGNVVEYIARHDLKNGSPGDFSSADVLYLSEIGIIVDDVRGTASALQEAADLRQYRGGDDQFTALGDEYGLLLVMKRGRILNFNHENQDKAARVFPTSVQARGAKQTRYEPENLPYRVVFEADRS